MAVGEWDHRQLCPDGGCVGVIGPDGTCKVCGRAAPNWGDERKRGLIDLPEDNDEYGRDAADEDSDEASDEASDDEASNEQAPGDAVAAASSPPGDWEARTLCPDGSCIGLIGPDGHCGVCGKVVT
jgi:hypothetical protein